MAVRPGLGGQVCHPSRRTLLEKGTVPLDRIDCRDEFGEQVAIGEPVAGVFPAIIPTLVRTRDDRRKLPAVGEVPGDDPNAQAALASDQILQIATAALPSKTIQSRVPSPLDHIRPAPASRKTIRPMAT